MKTLQFRTPHVGGQWAASRNTHDAVAMAIHAISDNSRSPHEIWEAPTEAEYDNVALAVNNYLDNGLFDANPDGCYPWGCETVEIKAK
jgi:hypothetical protein